MSLQICHRTHKKQENAKFENEFVTKYIVFVIILQYLLGTKTKYDRCEI